MENIKRSKRKITSIKTITVFSAKPRAKSEECGADKFRV